MPGTTAEKLRFEEGSGSERGSLEERGSLDGRGGGGGEWGVGLRESPDSGVIRHTGGFGGGSGSGGSAGIGLGVVGGVGKHQSQPLASSSSARHEGTWF